MVLKKGLLKITLLVSIFVICSIFASAALTHTTNKLNYFSVQNHTIYVTWTGPGTGAINSTFPADFAFAVTDTCGGDATGSYGCTCSSATRTINCTSISNPTTYSFVIESLNTGAEYAISQLRTTNGTASYDPTNISFLKINDREIFHTLIEYGRGRGNYFYDTYNTNLSGSGHTETGCNYLPNGTDFELTYLHKILNIKQYFGLSDADAKNATFECIYPNNTIVRVHLDTQIGKTANAWDVNYSITTIEGSWERMAYLSQDVDAAQAIFGTTLNTTCKNIRYLLPAVNGNISIVDSNISLQIRNKLPFAADAGTTATVGNGTQEVQITYHINNTEVYGIDNLVFEIKAPLYSQFIGARGELWGAGQDVYRYERAHINTKENVTLNLIARFDTSSNAAQTVTQLNLTQGITIQYLTCWEANAYNPNEYLQTLGPAGVGTVTVDMSSASAITNVENVLASINTTVVAINSTVTNIQNTVNAINTTLGQVNATLFGMNTTLNSVFVTTNNINATVIQLNNTLNSVNTTLNGRFNDVNASLTKIYGYDLDMNVTLTSILTNTANLQTNISQILGSILSVNNSVLNLQANFTWMMGQLASINITLDNKFNLTLNNLTQIRDTVTTINTTIHQINTSLYAVNTTIMASLTNINNTMYSNFNISQYNTTTMIQYLQSINSSQGANYTTDFNNIQANFTTAFSNLSTITTYVNNISALVAQINITVISQFNDLNASETYLLAQMQELRQFDEELVFLVTDSVGMTQQAVDAFNGGDTSQSLEKLQQASISLQQASARLDKLRTETITKESGTGIFGGITDYTWVWGFVLAGLILTLFVLMKRHNSNF